MDFCFIIRGVGLSLWFSFSHLEKLGAIANTIKATILEIVKIFDASESTSESRTGLLDLSFVVLILLLVTEGGHAWNARNCTLKSTLQSVSLRVGKAAEA